MSLSDLFTEYNVNTTTGTLQLYRSEVGAVSSTSFNTLCVLPSAARKEQKIVVGDKAGFVSCFRYGNKIESECVYRVSPAQHEVTSLCLGGPRAFKDKIYVACGPTIIGLKKKKGKEFFRLHTSLGDNISSMCVDNKNIWTASDTILNRFENLRDSLFYTANDRINSMALEQFQENTSSLEAILGCQDRYVRIIQDSNVLQEHATSAPVTSVSTFPCGQGSYDSTTNYHNSSPKSDMPENLRKRRTILYGCDDGELGVLLAQDFGTKCVCRIHDDANSAAVRCITHADITKSGTHDVIVGRDDGRFELYQYQRGSHELVPLFSVQLNESVRSIASGHISTLNEFDIVVCTYSGTIINFSPSIGFDSDIIDSEPSTSLYPNSENTKDTLKNALVRGKMAQGISELQKEIENIDTRVQAKKEEYRQLSNEMVAVETQFILRHSLRLLVNEACYLLDVEIDKPIDVVALQIDSSVVILEDNDAHVIRSVTKADSTATNDSNISCEKLHAIASNRCSIIDNHNKSILITLRFHNENEKRNRLSVKLRAVEGECGNITLFVVSKQYPKTCQTRKIELKPLSLHEKITPLSDDVIDKLSMNHLIVNGSFSLNQIHSWLSHCLPDMAVMPPVLPSEDDDVHLYFRSCLLDTVLHCSYRRESATISSDSPNTISIVKEHFSRKALELKVQLSMKMEFNSASVHIVLNKLRKKFMYYTSLKGRSEIIPALTAIHVQEGDETKKFLCDEYVDIINKKSEIEAELQTAPQHLSCLKGIIIDLLISTSKLRGRSYHARIKSLNDLLCNVQQFDAIIDFFEGQ